MAISKKLRKLLLLALVFVFVASSTVSTFAYEDQAAQQASVFGAAAEMASAFKAVGIDDQSLVTIMNLEKKAPAFYSSKHAHNLKHKN